MVRRIFAAVACLFALLFSLLIAAPKPPELLAVEGDVSRVHDPVIIREGETYYVFATGGTVRRSTDLRHWTLCGRVFEKLPDWAAAEIPGVRGGYWAPDISYYKGTYRLYYAVSTFGKNDSAIGLATNRTLDPDSPNYQWVDRGMVFRSRHDDDFNAIDPNLVMDEHGRHWLNFGSFWGGIKMRRIDPDTGLLSKEDETLYSLAERPRSPGVPDTIEAPFLVRHDGWYFLFVSFDFCCRGAKSTYNVVVGRAREITGPYLDRAGKPMREGGGTLLLAGTDAWRGPGHEGLLLQPGGQDLMVFHAYDGVTGTPRLHISTVAWDNGWPAVAKLNP